MNNLQRITNELEALHHARESALEQRKQEDAVYKQEQERLVRLQKWANDQYAPCACGSKVKVLRMEQHLRTDKHQRYVRKEREEDFQKENKKVEELRATWLNKAVESHSK
jgi:hypothetical protein